MNQKRQRPALAGPGAGGGEHSQALTGNSTSTRKPPRGFWTKRRTVLLNFIRRPSLHRFQAERVGEHCLHTTVATWQADGIEFARETIPVPGWGGQTTYVSKYWLTEPERQKAKQRLASEMCAAGLAGDAQSAMQMLEAGETA